MDKDSVLCQLMGLRVNGVLNRIVEADADYQEIVRKSGECSDRLDALELPEEVRLMIAVCQRTERARRALRRPGLPAWLFRLHGTAVKAVFSAYAKWSWVKTVCNAKQACGIHENFAEQISGYAGITELNFKIINQLIEKILVSEPVEIDGQKFNDLLSITSS